MNDFRILQTKPLTHALPYKVEERCRVWYSPWPVWRTLQDRYQLLSIFQAAPMRFQTTSEARLYIEQNLAARPAWHQRQSAAPRPPQLQVAEAVGSSLARCQPCWTLSGLPWWCYRVRRCATDRWQLAVAQPRHLAQRHYLQLG